eukprot:2891491-Amphidinium_carterae.1
MGGAMQAEWQHSLPSDADCKQLRINLTFRHISGAQYQAAVRHSKAACTDYISAIPPEPLLHDLSHLAS